MSLRWRFAAIFAAGTILATVLVAAAAVWTTGRSLESQVDQSLFGRFDEAELARIPDLSGNELRTLRAFTEALSRAERQGALPARSRRPPFLPGLDSTLQVNEADGSVLFSLDNAPELPFHVPSATSPEYRTIEIEDVSYRVGAVAGPDGTVFQLARDLSENQAVLAELRGRIVTIGIAFAILAGIIGWLVARRVVTPVEELSAAAEDIARTRDLSIEVGTSGADEVGRLSRSFATMVDALRTSRAQQRRLVQDASHELRTPLTSLRTNVEMLQRTDGVDAEDREAILADIESELRELSDLVTELVELATDAERGDEPTQELDLGALVEGVAERARRRTGRVIEVDADSTRVAVRPSMIERAVSNLIDNAHKWSPDPSPIQVCVTEATVRVLDSGPGIDEGDLPKIFDRFYRTDEARAKPGSGLGLAIVKQLVEAHDGNVFARNRPGGGAEVGFSLSS